ncbi:MAG: Fic family protein [Legionellales bacterium]|nr:Fic family protein [Legionellales bacterium]
MADPYVYPGTQILINKLNIKNSEQLEQAEAILLSTNRITLPKLTTFDYEHLKTIHKHLFHDLYAWAGKERTVNISKNEDLFSLTHRIKPELDKIFKNLRTENQLKGLSPSQLNERAAFYFGEINAIHPFREGNGRTQRVFFEGLFEQLGYRLDWAKVDRKFYLQASIDSFKRDYRKLEQVFHLTSSPNTFQKTFVDNTVLIKEINNLIALKQSPIENRFQITLTEKQIRQQVKQLQQKPDDFKLFTQNNPKLAEIINQLTKKLRVKR